MPINDKVKKAASSAAKAAGDEAVRTVTSEILKWLGKALLVLLGGVMGVCASPVILADHYIAVDSFNTLIRTHFVSTGLVQNEVLELEDADKQFSYIEKAFELAGADADDYRKSIENVLVGLGEDKNSLKGLDKDALVEKAENSKEKVKTFSEWEEDLKKIEKDIAERRAALDETLIAEFPDASLTIKGELVLDKTNKGVATINGVNYFSENLIEGYITDDSLTYSEKDGIVYGYKEPKCITASVDMISSDSNGYELVNEEYYNYTYTNGKSVNGFAVGHYTSTVYYNLGGRYSKMTFDIGHIEGRERLDGQINIAVKRSNSEGYVNVGLKNKNNEMFDGKLSADMIPESLSVYLDDAVSVRITVDAGSVDQKFGISNIKLYT